MEMSYTLGKWLEKVETKLNAILQINGLDPDTLQPLDQTPDETPGETQEPEEPIDTEEPEAQTQEELQGKAKAIQKSMNRQRVDVSGNPIEGQGGGKQ